ncbi:MAG TPA: hypothetical protein VLJ41_01185 [Segetibacter sp.]|nr:hypothetical protein [Segetibacter sp.]
MNRIIIVFATLLLSVSLFAQEEEEPSHKFRRDNIFIGGAIGLGLSSGGFSAGANPEIGYTIAQWLDAGFSTNFNYYSYSAEYNGGVRQRSFNYGAGVFVRAFPIRNVFLQVLPEYNRINTNLKDAYSGQAVTYRYEAPSLLLGIGYASRDIGRSSFYTVLMFDAGNNENSPYIGYLGSKQPILRTGFNFYLRPRRK